MSFRFVSFCVTLVFVLFSAKVFGQDTYSKINTDIFQAKCVSCHNATTNSGNLNLSGNATDIYNRIVGANPTNTIALAKGYKLIDPGYPERSFLLKKCAAPGWDNDYSLETGEGAPMPNSQPSLANKDIELIRQWILFGAKQNGTAINPTVLYNYYHVNGMEKMPNPAPPAPGEGFQIRLGTTFLAPGAEVEYYKKHKLNLPDSIEIKRIDVKINTYSHHFLIFKFEPGTDDSFQEGLRVVNTTTVFPSETKFMVGFTRTDSLKLPPTTAFFVQKDDVFDLNYHFVNYNQDSVFAADAYINIYTQPIGTAQREMLSELVIYPPLTLIIPYNQEYTFTEPRYVSGSTKKWNIWMLSSHTHKYGTSYNIFKRNSDGTRGEQIYNGNYDETYTFDVGYYDWAHPPVRYFDPLYAIDAKDGLIHEATFKNTGTQPFVRFGLTSDDEMMLYFIQYIEGSPIGIDDAKTQANKIIVSPNPYKENTSLSFELKSPSKVNLAIYNTTGSLVKILRDENMGSGAHRVDISSAESGLSAGFYLLHLKVNDEVFTTKMIQTK